LIGLSVRVLRVLDEQRLGPIGEVEKCDVAIVAQLLLHQAKSFA
jgi:hypothetical protein